MDLVPEVVDEVDLRVNLENVTTGALTFADTLAEAVLADPTDVHLVALASAYKQARRTQRLLRKQIVRRIS